MILWVSFALCVTVSLSLPLALLVELIIYCCWLLWQSIPHITQHPAASTPPPFLYTFLGICVAGTQASELCSSLPYPAKGEHRQRKCSKTQERTSHYVQIYMLVYAQIYVYVDVCADLRSYSRLLSDKPERPVAFWKGGRGKAHLKMPITKFNLISNTEAEPVPPLCSSPSSDLPLSVWGQTKSKRICQRFLHLNFCFKFNLKHLPPFVAHQTVDWARGKECKGGRGRVLSWHVDLIIMHIRICSWVFLYHFRMDYYGVEYLWGSIAQMEVEVMYA